MNGPVELDELDAMLISLVLVEEFVSLPLDDMNRDTLAGVMLLFEQVLRRTQPLLPQGEAFNHVHAGITKAERVGDLIRARMALPRLA